MLIKIEDFVERLQALGISEINIIQCSCKPYGSHKQPFDIDSARSGAIHPPYGHKTVQHKQLMKHEFHIEAISKE